MKYEYDSRKNCASQMKREPFFSVAHLAIPLPTVNYSLLTINWIHTFSAKERDTETGYSYFGSRYYSSELSIWLSVDPMSDKYPYQSNYVYCRNNPIILVDPNGCDDYWISQKGKIHKHKHTNANRDRFFWGKIQYNDKGQITNDYVSIAKSNYNEKSFKDKSGVNNKNQPYSRYDFHNPSDANAVYEFIQSKNPENEWSCINIVTSDASIGILTSGGQNQLEPGSSAVFDEFKIKHKSGGFIILESHRHNHPSGNRPSRADYETAEKVRKYSPDAKFILDRYKKESISY